MTDESQKVCGGECCRDFVISMKPADIGWRYEWAIARIFAGEASNHDWEIVTIAEMVIRIDEDDEAFPRYRCRNLTPAGLCGAYDRRPNMCRDYPGYGRGGDCNHCGFVQAIPPCRRLRPGLPVIQ